MAGYVYVLHFSKVDESPVHYIGHTSRGVSARFKEHLRGRTMTTAALLSDGYVPVIAKWWADCYLTDELELQRLQRHNDSMWVHGWCPVCNLRTEKTPHLPFYRDRILPSGRRHRESRAELAARWHSQK